jgi:carboxymethylenebutenolidase
MMRKFWIWAIASFFLRLMVTAINLQGNKPLFAADYPEQLSQSHHQDRPIATPLSAQPPKMAVKGELVNYGMINNQQITGYIARPANQNKPLPALIVIHEWWGLNDNIKAMTERLAGEGYVALAVDLYQGKVADNPQKARELVTNAFANSEQLKDNIRLAYQYLDRQEKAPKIGTIGWCFGGHWSLKTALLFPQEIDATVIYYGGNLETNPEILQPLEMPILGIFGALDQNPSVAQVKQFQQSLESFNKPVEIYIYEDADHAFANPSGTRYKATAAADAWEKTVSFLGKNLQN